MNPTYDFRGQVAVVTGASSGMGRDTVHAFATAGAAVVLADMAFNNAGIQVSSSDAADEPADNFERVPARSRRRWSST